MSLAIAKHGKILNGCSINQKILKSSIKNNCREFNVLLWEFRLNRVLC